MLSPWPGGACRPCREGHHGACRGWDDQEDLCGCATALCALRLITGVMWRIQDSPNGKPQGD